MPSVKPHGHRGSEAMPPADSEQRGAARVLDRHEKRQNRGPRSLLFLDMWDPGPHEVSFPR